MVCWSKVWNDVKFKAAVATRDDDRHVFGGYGKHKITPNLNLCKNKIVHGKSEVILAQPHTTKVLSLEPDMWWL